MLQAHGADAPASEVSIMPDVAAEILAEVRGMVAALAKVEQRLERLEGLASKVAVLERQDENDRDTAARWEKRLADLESGQRALVKIEGLEEKLRDMRKTLDDHGAAIAAKAAVAHLDAEASRITALETDRSKRDGFNKAALLAWTLITAAPGLVGLGIALWKLQAP